MKRDMKSVTGQDVIIKQRQVFEKGEINKTDNKL